MRPFKTFKLFNRVAPFKSLNTRTFDQDNGRPPLAACRIAGDKGKSFRIVARVRERIGTVIVFVDESDWISDERNGSAASQIGERLY
jgi:hypothetical protein